MSVHEINHGADAGHESHEHHGGSMSDYVKGFIFSVILTAIPFALVMGKVFSDSKTTIAIILAFAFVQVLVHMRYFLHMSGKSEGGWTILALIFTVTLVVIMFSGSVWVMYHLDTNMMPSHVPAKHEMP
ncbi:cytochrome bo3 quinol oxidase subunit 4 [Polynucleobacter meluiroseus]|uniref:Cytochrome bo(3) ubiquinol oxidase subunit 4 n=1 Tax=Polynucleobacter meluiroseus TaxID=1938814 RepID=A0A240E0T2_9BURK|nr:cytochrome o ubiquinol oxidase subunit IV [Polynucleobacter meluiroseus]SNX28076.1 cytochrome bo3 quinol oxidase subunit 4 [Polynucleobacter meluiroseus]